MDQREVGIEASYQEFHKLLRHTAGAEIGKEFADALTAEGKVRVGEN